MVDCDRGLPDGGELVVTEAARDDHPHHPSSQLDDLGTEACEAGRNRDPLPRIGLPWNSVSQAFFACRIGCGC